MVDLGNLEGFNLRFRLVEPEDAAYVHGLRHTPEYGRYLSTPAATVEAQRTWIEGYKARESLGQEYYFIIERRDDGARCGVIRLYDIADGHLTWGSWILDVNKPAKAALDSVLLTYKIAFGALSCKTAFVDARVDNAKSLAFQRRFGTVETGSDGLNVYFKLDAEEFAGLVRSHDEVFLSMTPNLTL